MSTISVEARYLRLVEDGHEVLWQSNRDLAIVLHRGANAGIDVPSTAEGGFVLVGLDVDGEGYDIVQTETPPGSAVSGERSLAIIAKAITALTTAERGIRAAEGQNRSWRSGCTMLLPGNVHCSACEAVSSHVDDAGRGWR